MNFTMTDSEGEERQQPEELTLNVPEEVGNDPVLVSRQEEEELPEPTQAQQTTRPLKWYQKLARSRWLDFVSNLIVLLSCVTMSMYTPLGLMSPYVKALDILTFAFFMGEMLIKMLGLGVCAYVKGHGNKLEMVINFGQMMDYILAAFGIPKPLLLALRPLRLLNRTPEMEDLLKGLMSIVPRLAGALFLLFIVINIFSIMGVQLWAGQLHNRCYMEEDVPALHNVPMSPYYMTKNDNAAPFICSPDETSGRSCHDVPPYRQNGAACELAPPGYTPLANEVFPTETAATASTCVNWNKFYEVCRPGDVNPNRGVTNFDNVGFAWISVFQVISLEGWTDIMYMVMDADSSWSLIFFIVLTIIGSFIMWNLCAVIIAAQFSKTRRRDSGPQNAASFTELWNIVTWWLKQKYSSYRGRNRVRPFSRSCRLRRLRRSSLSSLSSRSSRSSLSSSSSLSSLSSSSSRSSHSSSSSSSRRPSMLARTWELCRTSVKRMVKTTLFNYVMGFAVSLSIIPMAIQHHEQTAEFTEGLRTANLIFNILFVLEMLVKLLGLGRKYFRKDSNILDLALAIFSLAEIIGKVHGALTFLRVFRMLRFVRLVNFLPLLREQLHVLKRTIMESAVLFRMLMSVILVFSALGAMLFGPDFNSISLNGTTIDNHFDSLLESVVTVFQVLTLENWNTVLYNAVAGTSPWAFIYFLMLLVIGRLTLLNVLVGVVVHTFQQRHTEQRSATSPSQDSPSPDDEPSTPRDINLAQDSAPDDENRTSLTWRLRRWCKQREDWSLYLLSPENRFRVVCKEVVNHKLFEYGILVFILLSCVTIAMQRPGIDPNSVERSFLKASHYLFSAVFLVEMLLKVLAHGLVIGKDTYCRSGWNILDGSLVLLSWAHIFVRLAKQGKNDLLGVLKVLRLLRTLRPLRMIRRAPRLRLAVEALTASIKPMSHIILISATFIFFCGILGVQLFKGTFHHCVGDDISNITSKAECLSANYQWVPQPYNFDNLLQGLISLFVMYSTDGWVTIMHAGLDAVAVDMQPVRNYSVLMLGYFIPFMIMSIILLDMFIGVMAETYHMCQQELEEMSRREGVEELQRRRRVSTWAQEIDFFYSPARRLIYKLCTSKYMDLFTSGVIFICLVMMAVEHYGQPQFVATLTEASFYVLTACHIIEVVMKLVAFGVQRFFQNRWSLLDIGLVLISAISILLNMMNMSHVIRLNPNVLQVLKMLRLAHGLKVKWLKVLLRTIFKTLSQVGNICLLFAFFFFIYAALGVELFGRLECSDDYPCVGLNHHANFHHFGMALLTLYKVCTGDNWSGIMQLRALIKYGWIHVIYACLLFIHDTLRECRPDDERCLDFLYWFALIYFISFVVMAQYVLVNLVVAVIMQALEDSEEEELKAEQDAEQDRGQQALPPVEESSSSSSSSTDTDSE